MNEIEFVPCEAETVDNTLDEDIEIDGESFHIEEFEASAEEYRELVDGVYRSFYEDDLRKRVEDALKYKETEMRSEIEEEIKQREQKIREETKRDIIRKISQRRLRPDENGLSCQHTAKRKDVSKMTRDERAMAAKKAAGGLIINFK